MDEILDKKVGIDVDGDKKPDIKLEQLYLYQVLEVI